ncbi:Fusaridione A cluster transcription factor fsdR [Colletotrichum orbiculare MAFF 240422]|uniref:Fusaridione A cluster transcription factor fsdR n=1 Tax=Colletotrichum orbiculare (strain 104-T / ATCC 96160 / CBS 514.97 / LARS 414 / MAFF 240422) TaxID=1213857 RepID=A0A484FWE3_COLOR|nr:Fusaridione A cluster transcription factor fsdR [Colletotrichum orbiculare MAFF 240422]
MLKTYRLAERWEMPYVCDALDWVVARAQDWVLYRNLWRIAEMTEEEYLKRQRILEDAQAALQKCRKDEKAGEAIPMGEHIMDEFELVDLKQVLESVLEWSRPVMDPPKPRRVRRRKACDLCYHKKIKCDAKQPRCSGCKLYNSECTYTAPTRTTTAKPNHMKKIEMLEARLAQLEAQDRQGPTLPPDTQSVGVQPTSALEISSSSDEDHFWALGHDSTSAESPSYLTDQESVALSGPSTKTLPPLRIVLPIVDDYFTTSNQVLPLFDRERFMKMLRGWYTYPAHRKPDAGAAVNIVLALAQRHSYASTAEGTQNMQKYINNVQSVLNELIVGEPELLVLQIVLGLVIVFHGASDPAPASILVATAIRLVHGLKLHMKLPGEDFEPVEAMQRDREMLPSCWDKLVNEARVCMHLYAATPENDSALTWLVSCGYLTSIMFITVNNLAVPEHPCRLTDQSNVESALLLLDRLIKTTDDSRLKKIHGACKELNEKARKVAMPPPASDFFEPPGLEFGDEDPLDDGRWELMDGSFWATSDFGQVN